MSMFAIKLFFGKAFSLLMKNWKIFLAITLLVVAYTWHSNQVSEAYVQGGLDEGDRVAALIEAEDKRNREFEKRLAKDIASYVEENKAEDKVRFEKETKTIHTIEQILKDNPVYEECIIDQDVIDARNEIRALGPDPIEELDNEEVD